MDPLAVHLAIDRGGRAHALRRRARPIIEAEVYRFFHQNGPYPGSAFGYRTKEEEAAWRERDPLTGWRREMQKLGLVDDDERRRRCASRPRRRCARPSASCSRPIPRTAGKRRIQPELWPDPAFVDVGLRGDASELAGCAHARAADEYAGEWRRRKFVDAVAAVMGRRMERGRAHRRARRGRAPPRRRHERRHEGAGRTQFPDRVLGTPISENAFAGLGGGMALDGRFRPVVEFMYPDFMWVAADQVFNQIGKARHMFGGDNPVPLVLRTKVAMGSGYGSQHLMDPAGIFATSPGWRIVAPSTPPTTSD